MLQRTPLYETHQRLGARLVEFGGWEMPVQYTSIVDEHLAVRGAAGLFDICHMGEVRVTGKAGGAFLNHLLTNDIGKAPPGCGQYTLMCNERGGVVDDLYAYHLAPDDFLLVINASRIAPDVAWMESQLAVFPGKAEVRLENVSDSFGAIALQGPLAVGIMEACFPASGLKKNEIGVFEFGGAKVWVARTGYTGEDGFEMIAPAGVIVALWDSVMTQGRPRGLKPAGLGARDTLRTEVCYPLYGHELDENTTPMEAGVGFFVALEKGDFIGRSVLARQKAEGVAKRCVAFRMTEKSAPPRPHYPIWSDGTDGRLLGEVVSGTQSPSLNVGIGMGYVPPEFAKAGTVIQIEIRGRKFPAVIVKKPIYQKK